jgi:hypothetical protein
VPDVDNGRIGGSVSVEEGFDGGSGGFNIDSLELTIGVSGKLVNGFTSHPLPSFLLPTIHAYRLTSQWCFVPSPRRNPVAARSGDSLILSINDDEYTIRSTEGTGWGAEHFTERLSHVVRYR